MPSQSQIREVVATILRVDVNLVSEEYSVAKLNSSLDRTKLNRGLARLGIDLPAGTIGPRFSDFLTSLNLDNAVPTALASGVLSGNSDTVETVSQLKPNISPLPSFPGGTLKLGIDIEMVSSLPDVSDTWEDGFYRSVFSSAEIARSQVKPNPRVHLAGLWCAKEALRKSGAEFLNVPLLDIEICHNEDGSPVIRTFDGKRWTTLSCTVSISHTEEVATAIVGWIM